MSGRFEVPGPTTVSRREDEGPGGWGGSIGGLS